MTVKQAGVSPFTIQKIRSQLSTQGVKVGIASAKATKVESFVATKPNTVADVVYTKGSPAEKVLQGFKSLGTPTEIDRNDNEYLHTISVTPGVDIRTQLAKVPGIVGVYLHQDNPAPATDENKSGSSAPQTVSTSSETSSASSPDNNEAALAEMGWNQDVRDFSATLTEKVKVAIISTGVDYENKNLQAAITKDLRVTDASNRSINGDFPLDTDGFGTQIASLLAHQHLGVAKDFIELIPIKVVSSSRNVEVGNITRGIALAVNKGAEVIVLPHEFVTTGCDPVLGHAMYKAREKGVTFIIQAGDGLHNAAKASIGFPVVAARDDGPASYEITSTPACWSRYFLGALSLSASQGFARPLPDFSNYGDDIELSAIGVDINTVALKDATRKTQGTALSAAWGAAAAAMAIAHHKTKKQRYGAWYIENLLVESAKRDPNSLGTERRNRFGSLINFSNLRRLLIRTESMTDDERRNSITTINPRQGDGWKPGEDKADLRYVAISLSKAVALPGDEFSYKVVAFFRSGEARDVTNDSTYTSISLQKIQDKEYLTLVRPGVIKVAPQEAFKLFKGKPIFSVSANFNHKQAQGFDSATIRIAIKPEERVLEKIEIISPKTPLRVGQEINFFSLKAKYVGSDELEDVTGAASWRSSLPDELRVSLIPGIIDARDAISGKSYSIFADFEGKTAELKVLVEQEQLLNFYVHNYLGQGGKIERGQTAILEARAIFRAGSKDREQMLDAVWTQGSNLLNSGAKSRALPVDTSKLNPGTYTFTAKAIIKSVDGSREVTASVQLTIVSDIKYIEIHLKTPIVQVGQPFFIDLRAYRFNNSYVMVTEDAEWSTDAPNFVTINRHGVGFVREGFDPRTVTATAQYKGHTAKINLAVILGSVVTGSNSLIDYVMMELTPRGYCDFPQAILTARYKNGSERRVSLGSLSFAELREDGTWGHATLPLYGGRTYRASATYNDGSQASGGGGDTVISTTFVMQKRPLDHIRFHVDDRDKPAIIYRDALSQRSFSTYGVCSLTSAQVTPATRTTARVSPQVVSIDPIDLGLYKVTAKGIYTGMGMRETKEGYFTIDVKDTPPERISVDALWHTETARNKSSNFGYGSKLLEVKLLDKNGRQIFFRTSDLEFELRQNGLMLDPKGSDRVWLEVEKSPSLTHNTHFLMHAFTKSLGERYEVTVKHKPTQLTGTRSFTDIGTWEVRDAPPPQFPSEVPPVVNSSVHPSCVEYAKAPTGLEFAGGTGTESDPLIICTVSQLLSYGKELSELEYCKTTKGCRGMPDPKNSSRTLFVSQLGDNLDFRGAKIEPIEFNMSILHHYRLDGDMRSISNYVIVDSERDHQALFRTTRPLSVQISNLVVNNPVVRGRQKVAALHVGFFSGMKLRNISVIGGSVWGDAVAGVGDAVVGPENVRVFGTDVRYERSAGGIAGWLVGGSQLLFTGSVAPSGVPGASARVGGVASAIEGTITDVIMTGKVIALNSNGGDTGVGGIAGFSDDGTLINSVMRGDVVSTGSGVGGIVGVLNSGAFGVNPAERHALDIKRLAGVIGARVEGNIWGGMSRKQLECIDKVAKILGVGGSTNCVGDIKSQVGGRSNVGGIVGVNKGGLIQDSVFAGTVRGISAVGGIVGFDSGVSNYVRNTSNGTVSASEGASDYGALIGRSEFLRAKDPAAKGRATSRLDSNVIMPSEGNPTWSIGTWGTEKQATILSNVPDVYDR